jgi:hypothetical protein
MTTTKPVTPIIKTPQHDHASSASIFTSLISVTKRQIASDTLHFHTHTETSSMFSQLGLFSLPDDSPQTPETPLKLQPKDSKAGKTL